MMPTPQRQSGVIAIYLSMIIGLLLLTSTTLAAQVSVSELSQSSQVDQSEMAYYAAEAGVEEAARRIDQNQNATVDQMFPEQFSGSQQPGDALLLTDNDGSGFELNGANGPGHIVTDVSLPASYGQLSWRSRKVYQQSSSFEGTQVKDESQEFDTSELCRDMSGFTYGSAACNPSGGNPPNYDPVGPTHNVFASYKGLNYCWTANVAAVPSLEVTNTYYQANASDQITGTIATEKVLVSVSGGAPSITGGLSSGATITANPNGPNGGCFNLTVNQSYRYITRVKVLFGSVGNVTDSTGTQDLYSLQYQAQLVEAIPQGSIATKLYIPNNSYLIDVVGQSGSVKRRLVARKLRNGRLIGIFDYLLYSGNTPLCKGGVNQDYGSGNAGNSTYDQYTCAPSSADNTN